MSTSPTHTNRLISETSPYLRQHAHNPVEWYPWGPEALERARQLGRPIFLSIGYSACHWCHVMEHESFEDPEIATILNEHFISIKVDREERPDLDQIYMDYVQHSTGHGGWPMSVFLTPELHPFYGGTYFPPDDRYGGRPPSFRRVLLAVAEAWRTRRDELMAGSRQATEQLRTAAQVEGGAGELKPELIRRATLLLERAVDRTHGGFGHAPKFLHTMDLRLLLRAWQRFGDEDALQAVRLTLDCMARGGICDQLGGGFARYSTDERWLVPHFEKMLYDNALLVPVLLETYQATGEPFFREIVEETLAWVAREMTSPEGPFFSTLDADSEGQEGKFYVWSYQEIEDILGPESAKLFADVYSVTPEGNWDDPHDRQSGPGKNILHRVRSYEQDARMMGLPVQELRKRLDAARQQLLAVRSQRVWPGRDEKVLTSWNGLMIGALAEAAQVLDQPAHATAAARAADFILTRMRAPDGRLLRTWKSGPEAKLNAYLEDYSFLIDGLVSLWEATFELRWLEAALDLAKVMIEQFWDTEQGGFYFTGRAHEALIVRNKELHDNAIPSGNGMAATALLRLARLTGRADLRDRAVATLRLCSGLMESRSMGFGQMLLALDFDLGPVMELAVVGDPTAAETHAVLRAIHSRYLPRRVLALKPANEAVGRREELVPLLAGKTAAGGVTTYLCENFVCKAPISGAAALDAALSLPGVRAAHGASLRAE